MAYFPDGRSCGVGRVVSASIAPEWKPGVSYVAGAVVMLYGKRYKAKAGGAPASATFDETKWDFRTVQSDLGGGSGGGPSQYVQSASVNTTTSKLVITSVNEGSSSVANVDATSIGGATPDDLPYGVNALDMTAATPTATDGSINIPTSVSATMSIALPVPAVGKTTDIVIQLDMSTLKAELVFTPVGGSASDIEWYTIGGDTPTVGKKYWLTIIVYNNPVGSAKPYFGVQKYSELAV